MGVFHMTWKSTAAASGVMIVATWLASHAPVGGPRDLSVAPPSAAHTAAAAADLQREADRLHSRLNQVASYRLPSRNPFRFGSRPARVVAPSSPVVKVEEVAPTAAAEPPTFRMVLSGIGEDVVDDQVIRTAIISTPDNVHILKIGDTLGESYKVTKIDAAVVELVRLADGSTVQLALKR
jgi:hypothetical protein